MITRSVKETREIGRRLADRLAGGENLLLCGDLGTGKTAFVQGLAEGLGVSEPVKSPTFTYLREYQLPMRSTRLAHFDLYRLPERPQRADLRSLELFERLADNDIITVVEWADRLLRHYDDQYFRIDFTVTDDQHREIILPKKLSRKTG